ncbi:MAG: hypothetical protein V2A76_14790 [Planctomycetota bacterium]
MSRASGHGAAGTRERDRKTVRVTHGKGSAKLSSGPDQELSEDPLFSTDKYRRAVPLFQPEQIKA